MEGAAEPGQSTTLSTLSDDQTLTSARGLNDSSTAIQSEDDPEGEPEVVPFDTADEIVEQSMDQVSSNTPLRKSLIDAVKGEGDKIVDLIENNAIIKVNAFNSADQEEADQFVQRFWYWRNYSSYLLAFFVMTAVLWILTYMMSESKAFMVLLGVMSSFIEALLGLPQLLLNFQKKSTHGLAFLLIAMWTWGDFYKFIYYIGIDGPVQLICCSIFQLSVDVGIMSQFWIYRKAKP